ncbi:PEP-CTERM sorting domain-containing protein [Rugamonas sp.]|uniref:PEP-CTERM sorting domain-containing protein n=1 Tax=Rugamonas sp. TaxID=1926287 RepID=UPI0025DBCC9D|nr:PEP-CTERM sorting domain-containing protein [Rugamonas sp.]
MKLKFVSLLLAAGMAFDVSAAQSLVTFSDGQFDGWVGRVSPSLAVGTFIDTTMGDSAPAMRTQYDDFMKIGIRYYSDSASYAGNYTKASSITVGFDMNALYMGDITNEFSTPLTKAVYIDFLDHKLPTAYVDSSVLSVNVGSLTQGAGWQHFSVTFDPRNLGPDWTNNSNNSAQKILSEIDELAIHVDRGAAWDNATGYDVAIDNISFNSVSAVPEPGSNLMLLSGLGLIGGLLAMRRRAAR